MREFTFQVAVGTTGAGKTYINKQIIQNYLKQFNMPVLIFDVNNEYSDYKALDFDINTTNERQKAKLFKMLTTSKPFVARVVPLQKNGDMMTMAQKKETYQLMGKYFLGGLLVLEDILTYEKGFRSQEAVGIISTLRHGRDLLLSFQGTDFIEKAVLNVIKYIRLHNIATDPFVLKKKIPDLLPIQVAYILIRDAYLNSHDYIKNKLHITVEEYYNNISKFNKKQQEQANGLFKKFYIKLNPSKILHISKEEFARGVEVYYRKYFEKDLRKTMAYNKVGEQEAIEILINQNLHYID